jgi:hypothetical protein
MNARQEAADWVEAHPAEKVPGVCTVVMHSVVWQYLPGNTQRHIKTAMRDAGSRADAAAPLAWLHMRGKGGRGYAELRMTLWPEGKTRLPANCDWHGRWIECLGARAG